MYGESVFIFSQPVKTNNIKKSKAVIDENFRFIFLNLRLNPLSCLLII